MNAKGRPSRCPSCGGLLRVVRLACPDCEAQIEGDFQGCGVCALESEARAVLDHFLEARGNLKEVQRSLGVSYPTTRQRVEEMFRQLLAPEADSSPRQILGRLRAGEIDVAEAERLLRSAED